MLLKLNPYKFKLECYTFRTLNVISIETRKKIGIEYTQKEMIKIQKNQHKRKHNAESEGQKSYIAHKKQQKFLPFK